MVRSLHVKAPYVSTPQSPGICRYGGRDILQTSQDFDSYSRAHVTPRRKCSGTHLAQTARVKGTSYLRGSQGGPFKHVDLRCRSRGRRFPRAPPRQRPDKIDFFFAPHQSGGKRHLIPKRFCPSTPCHAHQSYQALVFKSYHSAV